MIIDAISDLHGHYPTLEGGDLLIVAGDLTARDSYRDCHDFGVWLRNQPYRKKIVIAGNHDNKLIGKDPRMQFICDMQDGSTFPYAQYLCDSGTEFEGLKIWGSPWTKTFRGMNPHCKAFTCDTEDELADKFDKIPHDVDILITHSPAWGCLDINMQGKPCGSRYLYAWFKYVARPKLHVCGHIHEAYGTMEKWAGQNNTRVKSVNASHVNENYEPINKPIRVIL